MKRIFINKSEDELAKYEETIPVEPTAVEPEPETIINEVTEEDLHADSLAQQLFAFDADEIADGFEELETLSDVEAEEVSSEEAQTEAAAGTYTTYVFRSGYLYKVCGRTEDDQAITEPERYRYDGADGRIKLA